MEPTISCCEINKQQSDVLINNPSADVNDGANQDGTPLYAARAERMDSQSFH